MRRVRLIASSPDDPAAEAELEALPDLELTTGSGQPLSAEDVDLVWMHGTTAIPPGLLPWLEAGGRLLATLDAAEVPHLLGIEPVPPDEKRRGIWRHEEDEFWLEAFRSFQAFPHIRGLAAFGPHPLFAGMNSGTYTWAPRQGETYRWTAYCQARPGAGSVVAVERSFIHLNPERIVAWEYAVGTGGILCIGAFINPGAPDRLLVRQLWALLANALTGDAIPHRDRAVPVAHWPTRGSRCIRDSDVPIPTLPLVDPWLASSSPIALEGTPERSAPWSHAGRRMMLAGEEGSGLGEAWSHPFRVMKAVSLTIDGRVPEPRSIRVAPEEVVRDLTVGDRGATERCSTALERPVLIWEIDAAPESAVTLSWSSDLRRMWPYPAGAFGDLRWNVSDDGKRIWVGAAGASVQVVFQVEGGLFHRPAERDDAVPSLDLSVTGQGRMRIIAVAATDGGDLASTLRALDRKALGGIQRQRVQHAEQIRLYETSIESPDPDLSTAFEWAKIRTDSFLAETPEVGRSLLAGYAATRSGWGDGRPGYAWFFGRDACWTAFAQLAAGQREPVRDVIHFLSLNQDVSGKVLHEFTTSGLVHYDAADSTPLYLLLVGRYAAWTGDLEFLRKHWEPVERAYRFCLETDTDGDGIIENGRVGHGWIEHGPLGGAHVTLYLAACWIAALEALAPVADALGLPDLGEEMRDRAIRARDAVERRFLVSGEYALGLRGDGTPQMHRTAMLAVPLLLGVVDPSRCVSWLDRIASSGFTTPWGVRMIAADDPLFDPQGYHLGAVWPLYTGWVSLAEWRAGRHEAALQHLLANARLYRHRARGAFDEVLHGLEYRSAGVCPDQAWSAAMVLAPALEGLWGVRPSALDEEVTLTPWLPPSWREMSLHRLRVGRSVLDLAMRRRPGQLVVRIKRSFGPGLLLNLAPRLDASPISVMVDEVVVGAPSARFQVRDQHEVIFLS